MLPQNKDQVLLQNAVPPECPPQVLSQFVDSPPPNLASLSPHQTLPSSHLPLPTSTQAYFFSPPTQTHTPGPHVYSSDSNSDFVPLLYSSSLPRSSPSPHSTAPSKHQVCPSPPLTRSSSLSQLQNSSPHSYESPSHLQDFQSSTITSPSPTSPSGGIPNNKQACQGPPSRSIRSSGVAGGCVPIEEDPAEFKDIEALTQALVYHVGHRRIQRDLKLEFLQRLWLGITGPAPVLEYPICLVCLQLRTPSCPKSKYKTVPKLLAFPQLPPYAQGQESGCLRMGIGFSLHLSRRQAKDLHLWPKKCPTGVESQEESPHSQKPASQASVQIACTSFQAGSLQSVDLQSPKPSQCSWSLLQEPSQTTAPPKPRPSVSKRSVPLKSILRKSSS